MNTSRYILATIATFIAIFVFEFLAHGVLLADIYATTAEVWRSQEEANMLFMATSQLLFAAVFVFVFSRKYEAKGVAEGFRFGLYIGLLLMSLDIGAYTYLPVPLTLIFFWCLISLLKGLLCGLVCSLIYKE